jgi:hypothetical protein
MAIAFFAIGLTTGALLSLTIPAFREMAITLIQFRVLEPVRAATTFGTMGVLLLIFLNNSVPVMLSFVYPALIAKVQWSPPLSAERRKILLITFTVLTAFLSGFFSVGMPLAVFWSIRGSETLLTLLTGAWLHGPIEIAVVLLCVAEPARLANDVSQERVLSDLRVDLRLMVASFFVLLVSAALEAVLGL